MMSARIEGLVIRFVRGERLGGCIEWVIYMCLEVCMYFLECFFIEIVVNLWRRN